MFVVTVNKSVLLYIGQFYFNFKHRFNLWTFADTSTLATQLSEILENQKIESVKPKEKSADEIARKEAILAQYGAVSDGETYPT